MAASEFQTSGEALRRLVTLCSYTEELKPVKPGEITLNPGPGRTGLLFIPGHESRVRKRPAHSDVP